MKRKRKNGLAARFTEWALGKHAPTSQEGYIHHGAHVSQWPTSYDDTPLDGDRYVGGKCCSSVGEYKAALAKENQYNISSYVSD